MIHHTTVGTDIAAIGLWDVQHGRNDLSAMPYAEAEQALQADAKGGRLFYINTGADGACDVHLYVDETVPPDLLAHYKSLNRQFLLRSPSGRLVAGGVEVYTGAVSEEDHEGDTVQVASGEYLVQLHELNEGDVNDPAHLGQVVGEADYAYFQGRSGGSRMGCGLLAAGLILLVFQLWMAGLPLFLAGVGILLYRSWSNGADERFQDIKDRIEDYHAQYPLFIFSLMPVEDGDAHEGGWHTLES